MNMYSFVYFINLCNCTTTAAEGNNLLGFITVIKINSSRRLKYRFGIRSVTFES